MGKPNRETMCCSERERHMEFCRSIIHGVEIKRCKNNSHDYKAHVHNELSLGYIAEGSTDLTLKDCTIHYELGDGVIIPPLMTHKCTPNDISHWAYVMLFVDPAYYTDKVEFHQAIKLTGNQARKLTGFIEQLLTEENPDLLENVLIELLLEFGERVRSEPSISYADEPIRKIHEYIINHVDEEIPLEKLEHVSGLNKFTIIRNFKKHYITTPAAYHLQYRVAQAKRLLSNGGDLFEICERMGFYDQAHLIREFKKMYGITPGSYMDQVKE